MRVVVPILCLWLLGAHEFYVGITRIAHTPTGETQITIKLFADDLERACMEMGAAENPLVPGSSKTDSLLFRMVRQEVTCWAGPKKLNLSYLGWEQEKDQVFIYVFLPEGSGIPTRIKNTLLMQSFPKQIHIIQWKGRGCESTDFTQREKPAIDLKCP